jgi:RNA polymerase sigma factor (TIGR02999 family)
MTHQGPILPWRPRLAPAMTDHPPAPPSPDDITVLLRAVRAGGATAESDLVAAVYGELRQLAAARLRHERAGDTAGPTGLVHKAWLRLGLSSADFTDRRHFFGAAARVMRQALIDRHRQRHSQKRAHQREEVEALELLAGTMPLPPVDLLALDEALQALEALDPRMAQIVQLRYFAGLSVAETAAALELSERTVKREWNVARAWLYQRLGPAAGD